DQRSGQSYYVVRIGLSAEELARLGPVKLVPGMPVEAFIKTYDRTVMSYFTKPLHDQILRAFRERCHPPGLWSRTSVPHSAAIRGENSSARNFAAACPLPQSSCSIHLMSFRQPRRRSAVM